MDNVCSLSTLSPGTLDLEPSDHTHPFRQTNFENREYHDLSHEEKKRRKQARDASKKSRLKAKKRQEDQEAKINELEKHVRCLEKELAQKKEELARTESRAATTNQTNQALLEHIRPLQTSARLLHETVQSLQPVFNTTQGRGPPSTCTSAPNARANLPGMPSNRAIPPRGPWIRPAPLVSPISPHERLPAGLETKQI